MNNTLPLVLRILAVLVIAWLAWVAVGMILASLFWMVKLTLVVALGTFVYLWLTKKTEPHERADKLLDK